MSNDTKSSNKTFRRGGTRTMAALVPSLTRRAIGKRGFAQASIITDWHLIVGPDLAKHSQPDRLSFPRGERIGGTLYIRAAGPMATELMHLESMLIDRINSHFGYGAIAAIRLVQTPIRRLENRKRKPPVPDNLTPLDREQLEKSVAGIDDASLKEVLLRLGSAVMRQKNATKSD
ncbi:MAG: DciA family protein [Alphaproteobacteria bacterium]